MGALVVVICGPRGGVSLPLSEWGETGRSSAVGGRVGGDAGGLLTRERLAICVSSRLLAKLLRAVDLAAGEVSKVNEALEVVGTIEEEAMPAFNVLSYVGGRTGSESNC